MASARGDPWGAFLLPGPSGRTLMILADDGATTGWEHVSVSTRKHAPNWTEMCRVKSLFWEPEDTVVQFHPPASAYVNNHPNCLHLWRWKHSAFPLPASIMVGIKELGELPQ